MRTACSLGLALVLSTMSGETPVQHSYTNANGVKLHYVQSGKGPVILFLHGFPEFWYEWNQIIPFFAGDRTVIAPDMRGYNLSEKPEKVEAYLLPVLVEDIRQLVLNLSAGRKVTLVAHDWGGAVAWAFAIAHPEMLDKLVIINAPHPAVFGRLLRSDPDQQKASQYMLMFRSPEAEAKLSADNYAWLQKAVLRWNGITEQDRKMYLDAWSQPGALTGGLNYYRANELGPPAPGEAPKAITGLNPAAFVVKVPTLVIWGEKDTALLTSNLDGLDKFVPDLKVERIPDGSHWVIHEQPEKVSKLIRDFLR